MTNMDDQNQQLQFDFMQPTYKQRVLAAVGGYMRGKPRHKAKGRRHSWKGRAR